MPIAPHFNSVHEERWTINFTQCAPNGYLNYVNLLNVLQLTAAAHSIAGGLSFNDMQAHHQAWVLSRIRVEIEDLPKWQDEIVVKTWIEQLQGANSVRNLEMYRSGKKIVGATTLWAVLNTQLRKAEPLALPHAHFEKFPDWHATSQPPARLNVLQDTQVLTQHTVKLSDLDIVNHANNTKYMEWCFDAIDAKPLLNNEIQAFEMNFLRELNLGDTVTLQADTSGKPNFFTALRDGKACFALAVQWR